MFSYNVLNRSMCIQTYKGDPIPLFGPLQDGMVVRASVLPELVRLTAATANRYIRFCFDGYRRPFPTRRTRINEIIERCGSVCVLCCVVFFVFGYALPFVGCLFVGSVCGVCLFVLSYRYVCL